MVITFLMHLHDNSSNFDEYHIFFKITSADSIKIS